jgi:hypothetical protein
LLIEVCFAARPVTVNVTVLPLTAAAPALAVTDPVPPEMLVLRAAASVVVVSASAAARTAAKAVLTVR